MITFKEARTQKGLTQKQISEQTGIDQATISRYENDYPMKDRSWEIVSKLAEAVGYRPEEVFPINKDSAA